jgi:hypothetical protein
MLPLPDLIQRHSPRRDVSSARSHPATLNKAGCFLCQISSSDTHQGGMFPLPDLIQRHSTRRDASSARSHPATLTKAGCFLCQISSSDTHQGGMFHLPDLIQRHSIRRDASSVDQSHARTHPILPPSTHLISSPSAATRSPITHT